MSEDIELPSGDQSQRPARTRTGIPRSTSGRTRGDERERTSETPELFVKKYTPSIRVSAHTAGIDKLDLRVDLGWMNSTQEEFQQTKRYLGAAPREYRRGDYSFFGVLCNRTPFDGMDEHKQLKIRTGELPLGGQKLGAPLMKGNMQLSKVRGGGGRSVARAFLTLNPTRAYNLNSEALLDHERSWRERLLRPIGWKERALVSLDGHRNVLPADAPLAAYKRCEASYLLSVFEGLVGSLRHATAFSRGAIRQEFRVETVGINSAEHYWEFEVESSLEFLSRIRKAVVAFKQGSLDRTHGQAIDRIVQKNSKSFKIYFGKGESITVYAKLNNRVRIEVRHKLKKQNGLIEGGYIARSSQDMLGKLDELAERSATRVNELLYFMEQWDVYSPQELARTARYSQRWFRALDRRSEAQQEVADLLVYLQQNGRICGGASLTQTHRNVLRRAKDHDLLRSIEGSYYPQTSEEELTELNSEGIQVRHNSETLCDSTDLSNPLTTSISWSSGGFLPPPPFCFTLAPFFTDD